MREIWRLERGDARAELLTRLPEAALTVPDRLEIWL